MITDYMTNALLSPVNLILTMHPTWWGKPLSTKIVSLPSLES